MVEEEEKEDKNDERQCSMTVGTPTRLGYGLFLDF